MCVCVCLCVCLCVFASVAMQGLVITKATVVSSVVMCAMTVNVTRNRMAEIVQGIANQTTVWRNTSNQCPEVCVCECPEVCVC